MKTTEIKEKFLEGNRLAIRRLIAKKKKEGTVLIVSDKGKVKKLSALEVQ
jgi:hypothetical protein